MKVYSYSNIRLSMALTAFLCTMGSECIGQYDERPSHEKIHLAELDGTTTFSRPPDDRFAFGSQGTIEFWVKAIPEESSNGPPCILSCTGENGVRFSIHLTPEADAIGIDNGNGLAALPVRLDDQIPHHVALATDSDRTLVFLDGDYAGSIYQGYGIDQASALHIGSFDGKRGRFSGQIGAIRIWKSVLSLETISAFMKESNADIHEWLWDHAYHPELIGYTFFSAVPGINIREFRFSDPIAGPWVEESHSMPKLYLPPATVKSVALPASYRTNHGNYVDPALYYIVPGKDPGVLFVYRDAAYYGRVTKQPDGTYLLDPHDVESDATLTLTAGRLQSNKLQDAMLESSANSHAELVRPKRRGVAFREPLIVDIKEQQAFDQITQLFPANYKSYNLRKMDPLNPVPSKSGSNYFVFQLPDHEFEVGATGLAAPSGLHIFSRREGSGSTQSVVISNEREMEQFMSIRAGIQAEAEVAGSGGGFSVNASAKESSRALQESESASVVGWSTALSYALIADKSSMKLHPDFRRRVMQLYQRYKSVPEREWQTLFDEFFEEVGTHYSYAVTYGGLLMFETKLQKKAVKNAIANEWDIEGELTAKASSPIASGKVTVSGGAGGKSENRLKNMLESQAWEYRSIGGGGMLMDAANLEGVEIADKETPVFLDLRPLEDLLSPHSFEETEIYHEFRHRFRDERKRYLKGNPTNKPWHDPMFKLTFTRLLSNNEVPSESRTQHAKWSHFEHAMPLESVPRFIELVPRDGEEPTKIKKTSFRSVLPDDPNASGYRITPNLSLIWKAPREMAERNIAAKLEFKVVSDYKTKVDGKDATGRTFTTIPITLGEDTKTIKTGLWEVRYEPIYAAKSALERYTAAFQPAIRPAEADLSSQRSMSESLDFSMKVQENAATTRNVPFAQSLHAYWPLDEDMKERSGNGGEILTGSQLSIEGRSLKLTNQKAKASVGQLGGSGFTWHCDFRFGSEQRLMVFEYGDVKLYVDEGVPFLQLSAEESIPLAGRALRREYWHKLCIAVEPDERFLRVYFNGAKLWSGATPDPATQLETTVQIGVESTPRGLLDGMEPSVNFDELLLYHRSLSSRELRQLSLRPRHRNQRFPNEPLWEDQRAPNLAGLWITSSKFNRLLNRFEIAKTDSPGLLSIRQLGAVLHFDVPGIGALRELKGSVLDGDVLLSFGVNDMPLVGWNGEVSHDHQRMDFDTGNMLLLDDLAEKVQRTSLVAQLADIRRLDLGGNWIDLANEMEFQIKQSGVDLVAHVITDREHLGSDLIGSVKEPTVIQFAFNGRHVLASLSGDHSRIRFENGLVWIRKPASQGVMDSPRLATDLSGSWYESRTGQTRNINQRGKDVIVDLFHPRERVPTRRTGFIVDDELHFDLFQSRLAGGISKRGTQINFPEGVIWHKRNSGMIMSGDVISGKSESR